MPAGDPLVTRDQPPREHVSADRDATRPLHLVGVESVEVVAVPEGVLVEDVVN